MNEEITKRELLNRASVAGLALGAVSSAYLFITQSLTQLFSSAVAMTAVTMILWMAKFAGCILLMRFFMRRLAAGAEGVGRRHTFKLGMYSALFSALIFAAVNLANVLYVNPEALEQSFAFIQQQYSSRLDSNSLAAIEDMKGNMPGIVFFSNFIYCFLYGTVLASILSRSIPEEDPFAGFRDGDQDSDVEEQ